MAVATANQLELADDLINVSDSSLVGYTDSDGNLVTGTLKRTSSSDRFTLEVNGITLTFDSDGNCLTEGYEDITLKNVNAKIDVDPSATQTRASDGAEVSVNNLVPIDQFAIGIIGAFLYHIQDVESLTDARILNLCEIAYKWAKAMIVISVTMRKANATGTTTSDDASSVKVDTSDLQTASEKLLNNVVASLDKLTAQVKTNDTNETTRHNAGVKVTQQGTVSVAQEGTVKVDNPTDDKFEIEGGGDSSIDYDKLNDITTNITEVVGFNNKAVGRTTLANLSTKLIALDTTLSWLREVTDESVWTTYATNIFNAIKESVDDEIDTKINTLVNEYGLTKPTT